MKNLIKSFAVLAAVLSFSACQKEGIVKPDEQTKVTHTVTFVADAPETKTVANIDRENGVVNYEWSSTDEDKDKFHVYENGVEGSVTAVSLVDGKMTIGATFTGEEPAEVEYTGYFNEGIKANQQSYNTDYDQDSDVLIARADAAVNNQIQFRFQRLGAICEVNLKGLAAGECLKTVKIESLDENVFLAGSIVNGELVGNSKTITIDTYNDINDGVATLRFVSLPIENANLRFIVETTNDGDDVAAKYVKRLGKAITFTQGDLKAFNVSSFSTVETTATFKANGTTVLDAVLYAEGEDIVFPEGQDVNAGNIFVGWTKNESYKAATAPSDLCTEDKMDAQSVVYNAVYGSIVGKAENPSRIVKLGASSSFAEGDVIAVFAKSGDNYYGMYQETVSTSWVNYFTLDHEPTASDFNDVKRSWLLSEATSNKWYFGDATNGYLQNTSTSNNLYAKTDDKTGFAIAWNNDNNAYTIKNGSRWIGCRADLTGDNQYKYRGAGDGGSPTSNSLAYFDIYKLVDIESYSTTIDTRMNSSLAWSESACSARLGQANTYPTLTTIPVDLKGVTYASSKEDVATIDGDGTITLKGEGETTITASFEGNMGYKAAEDASYVLTVLPAPSNHNVIFSINGVPSEPVQYAAEASIVFPSDPEGPYTGIVFKGWAKAAIVGTQDDAPEMVNKATEKMGDEDVTYFAVFATETDDSITNTFGWEEATTPSDWTIGGKFTRTEANASYSANSGSYYGLTNSNSSVQFKNKVKVKSFSYYCVRRTNNTKTSIKIETSTNGTTWTEALSTTWNTFNQDGKTYKKIEKTWDEPVECYVRVNLVTAANRQLDDVSITYGDVAYSDYCTTVKEPVVLSSIEVSGTPDKTTYNDGENFDPAGLTVTAVYSDDSEVPVTEGIEWSATPSTLRYNSEVASYSVDVTASALGKTSAVFTVNGLTVLEPVVLSSISVKTAPTKVEYTEGQNFDPTGLVIARHYSDGTSDDYTYAGHTLEFSFNPALTAALATTDTKLTITYQGKPVDQAITVNEKQVPTFSSLEALASANLESGTEVKVTFENVPIKSIYTTNQSKRQGVYFDIQKDGHDIEIYYSSEDVPESWEAEGTLSGTMTCPWTYYERGTTWELAPAADSWSWNNLTYNAPLDRCKTPEISISDAGVATITCATLGATIYYTEGESPADPTSASTQYTGEVTMADGETIKAIAYNDGNNRPSVVASKKYTAAGAPAAGTVMWSETWEGGEANETPSSYGQEGTTVYNGGTVTYSSSYSNTKLYTDVMATTNLLLYGNNKGKDTWVVTGIPTGGVSKLTLTLEVNNNGTGRCVISSPTTGITVGTKSYSGSASPYTITVPITISGNVSTFELDFANTTTSNVRIDNVKVVVAE